MVDDNVEEEKEKIGTKVELSIDIWLLSSVITWIQ